MKPVLYSLRRYPYAMRVRLAIANAGFMVELRRVVLHDKVPECLAIRPTQRCLTIPDRVIDESFNVMLRALE